MFSLRPVKGSNFINREELLNDMTFDLINSLTGYALYGKRRVGKTSIFKEIQRKLEKEEDVVVVYFSVWDLMSNKLSSFIKEFTAEVLESYKHHLSLGYRARNLLKAHISLLKDIIRKLNINLKIKDTIEVLLSFDESEANYDQLVEDCFNLPEKLAKETKTKCILLIDEFPSLMNLKDGQKVGENLIRKIRTIHEDHEHVIICISGSIKHTMDMVTVDPASPFYGQLIVKEIEPLEKKHVKELLLKNLSRISPDAINEIYEFSAGIPFYVQFLGKIIERKKNITIDVVKDAEESFIKEEGDIIFKKDFDTLGSKEREVLISLSQGSKTPSGIAKDIQDSANAVSVYLRYLEEKGYISRKEKGQYEMDDPVFERWMKNRWG